MWYFRDQFEEVDIDIIWKISEENIDKEKNMNINIKFYGYWYSKNNGEESIFMILFLSLEKNIMMLL